MLQDLTILANGVAAGLFGLTSALFLFVFKHNRLRVVLGVILAVYTLYLLKDIMYLYGPVASDEYLYRVLLSIDSWAVPLYVIYAFEVIAPGRMTVGPAATPIFIAMPVVSKAVRMPRSRRIVIQSAS